MKGSSRAKNQLDSSGRYDRRCVDSQIDCLTILSARLRKIGASCDAVERKTRRYSVTVIVLSSLVVLFLLLGPLAV